MLRTKYPLATVPGINLPYRSYVASLCLDLSGVLGTVVAFHIVLSHRFSSLSQLLFDFMCTQGCFKWGSSLVSS